MQAKHFIFYFFFTPLLILSIVLSLNLLIDPFGVSDYNLLNIEYKMARDDRVEKVQKIKKLAPIENLIIGSSRAQHLDPKQLSKKFGGSCYNFGVGGGNVEEALGILLYLETIDKLPKTVLLTLDFASFNEEIPSHSSFYKLPELNFLSTQAYSTDYLAKFLSIEAIRASFKTLKMHLKGEKPGSYFDINGLIQKTDKNKREKAIGFEKIEEMAKIYYSFSYSNAEYKLSKRRLSYLKRIVELTQTHSIHLIVTLTPVHDFHLSMIEEDKKLAPILKIFKEKLLEITPYCDAMVHTHHYKKIENFEDSVHYNEAFAKLYMNTLLSTEDSSICIKRF